jgi:hypothetical protein
VLCDAMLAFSRCANSRGANAPQDADALAWRPKYSLRPCPTRWNGSASPRSGQLPEPRWRGSGGDLHIDVRPTTQAAVDHHRAQCGEGAW